MVQLQMSKKNVSCVISGFRRGVNETFALLGCYASHIRRYRRFGTTFRSHLQESSNIFGGQAVSSRIKQYLQGSSDIFKGQAVSSRIK